MTDSVWRSGEIPVDGQFDAVYTQRTRTDRDGMPPAVAAHALRHYTRRGDLVLDPDCGAGATLIEALRGGRHAVGLIADRRLWEIARANVTAVKRAGAIGDGTVLAGGSDLLSGVACAGLTGRVDLVLTTIHHHARLNRRSTAAVDNLADTLFRCVPLLRPGGHVVITARPSRVADELLDLPGLILAAGRAAGLHPAHRRAALVATATPRRTPRHRGRQLLPVMRVAHHDMVVLRAPDHPTWVAAPLPRELTAPGMQLAPEHACLLRSAA
jgi:modification methylase